VRSVRDFWDMLLAGMDCVTEVPYSRFDIDEVYNPNPDAIGCSYTRHAAFMPLVEQFDCDFFDILVAEARLMDPHQRLLLEVAYEAFCLAGYDKKRLRGSSTGVFVGVANQDWTLVCGDQEVQNPFFGVGVSFSIISNRISYLLGLTGPSMTLDTACSSSLVAVDLAVEKLRSGVCSIALVGGINVMLHHRTFVGCCSAKMLSFKGRCAAFDASADGYCRGEGVGAVVLKRLSDAEADGDPILAVIRGTAVNQDGRSATLTAPNGVAQEAVIQQALTVAGIKGQDIDYIECHGTGTPLGDPIEIAALKNVLGKGRKKPLILGAVKTNIGHLEGAAGIIGLIKTVEVLRHRQAPEIVHFNTLNPKIDVADFNVLIPTSPTALLSDSQEQLLAGVSSFGFGGTNAHVILESYENKHSEPKPSPVYNPRFLPWRRLPHPCLSRVEENGFIVVLSGERAAMWQDHRINGNVFMPAASHVTLLGGAALLTQDPQAVGIEVCDITMLRPLIVEKEPRAIRVILKDQQWSLQDDHEKFANCQTTRLLCLDDKTKADFDIQAICKRCASIEIEPLYNTLAQEGMQFGPRYRNLNELFIGESEAIASVRTTSFPVGERALTLLHPAILDAGIQLLSLCGVKTCGVCVPFHIETARLFSIENQPEELWAYAYVRKASSKSIEGTVTLFDETGQVFAVLEGLTCRRFGTDTRVEEVLFETEWTALSSSTPSVVKALHEVLILSRAPVNISLPPHWRTLIVPTSDTFVLPSSSWSQLIFSVQETESDLELGLTLLQRLAQSPSSLEDKHIVFVVPRKNVMNAGLWGLIRSFRLEHPNVKICCVESTLEYSDQISSLSIKYPYEDEFSIDTNGVVYARRLCLSKRATPSQSIPIHSDATYVITGGQGALGLIVTQFLIEQGAKYLLLLSRTPQPIEKMPELLEMSKQAKIECLAADVAEEQSISKIQEWLLQNKWPHVRGIVHTAGVLTDGTIPNQSIDKLQHAFGPKVQGALNLHPGFPSVDFLILFSSAAATFGSVGQASYSAANAALDALAESWVKAGQPVLSIQWGAWSEVGMAVRHDAVKRAEAAGFGSITSNLGKAILAHLLHIGKRGVVCASPIDWATLKLNTPLINRFRPERKYSMKISSPSTNQYSGMDLLEIVRQAVKASIGKTVADNVPLMANGLDSLSAVILAQTLSQKIGLSLGSVFALNYPTITDMVKALLVQIQKNTQKAEVLGPSNHYSEDPIVVVSAACRVPGNVNSTDEFWEMLMSGTDCVTDIPPSRFDIDPFYDPNLNAIGRSYTRKGAFMSQVESFDHEFFGIPILEARAMDPQQRLLLEVAYEAFYAAGYEKESLYNLPIAVFIGQMNQDWAHMHTEEKIADPYFGAGSAASITSNRISYLLGLTGPSMTLDTACSSSLVAVDLAVEKLRSGVCSAALVGGVNVMLSHRSFVGCCSAKMLSFKGRCATFDASADGYCRGEGVGAVVLKRMKDAQADGNQILAIIRGTAVNQDGRSASLTAPNGLAQEAVIKRALEIAGLKGSDMDYIECHGTGTGLGDPIEVGALKNVLNAQRKKPVVLGAVKTNIGHLEGAAGVVGLIKAIEVLRHRRVPGNVHFKTLNPKIDLGDFPAIISNQPIALELNAQRTIIAGVSSFGFGGTNAHVILESANTYV
jgi:acyl transferase domain-containing protein/NAD(P)-dependent dehydrogenase (short-subunit alcohol dehydrogenase family)